MNVKATNTLNPAAQPTVPKCEYQILLVVMHPSKLHSPPPPPPKRTKFCKFRIIVGAQLVEALRYNPEGRGFDSRWCNWNFSLT